MTILRMSVFALTFALAANVHAQTNLQVSYKCSPGTSLKGGILVYQAEGIQAVAKHKDGTLSEISGTIGKADRVAMPVSWDQLSYNTYITNLMNSGVTVPGSLNVPKGVPKTAIAPTLPDSVTEEMDRDHKQVEPAQGDPSEARTLESVQTRAGDIAAQQLRPGDLAALQPKNGHAVVDDKVTAFWARLDSRGNISEISFRTGSAASSLWRAGALNSDEATSVYSQLNGELKDIQSRAYCCTQNPGANCDDRKVAAHATVKTSLRTEKPTIGQRIQSAWTDMVNAFKASTGSAAK